MTEASALIRNTPEAQGIRSTAIHAFVDAAEREIRDLHSIMLLRRGQVVAEGWWQPFDPRSSHMLFSLSKSFTSTAIGMLVADGRLSVDDLVLSLFPADAPPVPSANLQAMRVRHLLTMSTGHNVDATPAVFGQPDPNWVRVFLSQPVEHEPGSHFVYNTAATYVLSALVQRLTGERLLDYLQPRLLEPLGIDGATWEASPEGVDLGGTGLSLTTEAIARFGQLYLQQGEWQGSRLIPAAWVQEATARQVANGPSTNIDWEQGYGYQFWRCRHGAYRGDGAFGQFCIVMPEQEAVLAIASGVPSMQRVLDLVWQHLLPAMGPAPLPEDRPAQQALTERLGSLRLLPPAGRSTSGVATRVSGQTFHVRENADGIASIRFDFRDEDTLLTIHNDQGEQRIACGYQAWVPGAAAIEFSARRRDTMASAAPWQVAASGAWTDKQTYVAQLCWYETPFRRTLTCRFDGDSLSVEQQANVSFGSTDRPTLEGHL
jgi:CubicO group peptidase (beta-lactamase class C family)